MRRHSGSEILRRFIGRFTRPLLSLAFGLIALGTYCVSAAADTTGLQTTTPLWQQLLLATVGPAAATLFGGIWVQLIVERVQSARKRAELAAQDRLRDHRR